MSLPQGLYVYELEMVCVMCSRYVGILDSPTSLPPPNALVPRDLRCGACGGWPVFSGDVSRRLTETVPFTAAELPRRGRPPQRQGSAA